MKERKKKKSGSWLWNMLIVVAVAVMLFSGFQLFQIYREYQAGEEEYEDLSSLVGELKEEFLRPEKPTMETTNSSDDVTQESGELPEGTTDAFDAAAYAQWFAKLQEINTDIVGWISIEGTAIDYPVMYSGDNDYYLYRTYQGTHNGAGSIFMEGANAPDFSDSHTILYGHNMKNGSMFAGLHKYAKEKYYREHAKILLETADGPCWYEIFSCHTANAYDDLYDISYVAGEDFDDFVSCLKNLSEYDTGVSVTGEDQILTLSTCKGNGDIRFVVHAKRILGA